jgi:hypothetical protein
MNYGANALNVPGVPPQVPQGGQAVARPVSFVRAAIKSVVQGESKSVTLGTAVQNMSLVLPAVGGWNRRVVLQVVCVTAGNAAAVTFAADGPFNVLSQILFKDAAQKQLVLFTNGYYAYLMNNFGGYKPFRMDASTRAYAAVTGAGATGGSFTFYLTIPQEIARDGIGTYPNMDASQRLSIDLTINTNASIYGVAPTTPGTLTVTPLVWYYSNPAPVSAAGETQETLPVGAGTISFWRTSQYVLSSGNNIVTVPLSGRYLRNIFGIFTDGSDVRSDTVRPTTIRMELDNNLIFDRIIGDLDSDTYRTLQLDNPTGFIPLMSGTSDPDGIQGAEWADDWWPTSTSSQLVLKFSAGAAGKLYLITNEVEVKGSIFR